MTKCIFIIEELHQLSAYFVNLKKVSALNQCRPTFARMKVFLIGYMGSGKSTLGPKLAKALSIPFLDLDRMIAQGQNKTIQQIFDEDGEDVFRNLEKETLNHTIKTQNDFVMATGGGTPCFFKNMDLMKKAGTTIYINVAVKELVNRNLASKELRPLLRGMNELQVLAFINDHLKQRLPFYKKSSITLKDGDKDIERLIQEIKLMNHSR
jgi:shikimate kinase